MINRRTAGKLLFYIAGLAVLLRGLPLAAQQVQRETSDLRITAIDVAVFPTVSVRLLTTDAGSAPIADLTRLVLRENGVPIADTTTAQTPVGVDVVLVIDANADFFLFDDRSGLSRRDKVAASIVRYAGQFMDPAGLDRVSVIVPDEAGAGATFLAQDVNRPSDLADAVNAYNPTTTGATPLQGMMVAAIDHLAASEDGRFQAVLLYTDAARLDRQLDYPGAGGGGPGDDHPTLRRHPRRGCLGRGTGQRRPAPRADQRSGHPHAGAGGGRSALRHLSGPGPSKRN